MTAIFTVVYVDSILCLNLQGLLEFRYFFEITGKVYIQCKHNTSSAAWSWCKCFCHKHLLAANNKTRLNNCRVLLPLRDTLHSDVEIIRLYYLYSTSTKIFYYVLSKLLWTHLTFMDYKFWKGIFELCGYFLSILLLGFSFHSPLMVPAFNKMRQEWKSSRGVSLVSNFLKGSEDCMCVKMPEVITYVHHGCHLFITLEAAFLEIELFPRHSHGKESSVCFMDLAGDLYLIAIASLITAIPGRCAELGGSLTVRKPSGSFTTCTLWLCVLSCDVDTSTLILLYCNLWRALTRMFNFWDY